MGRPKKTETEGETEARAPKTAHRLVPVETLKVRLTFTEPILGSSPSNPNIYRDFVASKAPEGQDVSDELAGLPEEGSDEAESKKTIFRREEGGTPYIMDYQVRGFLKEAASACSKMSGSITSDIKAYKKEITSRIFVFPRNIPLRLNGTMDELQRPLRANTPQGERTALTISDEAPAGSFVELEIKCFCKQDVEFVKELLYYGEWQGLGQWRNASYGRFVWEPIGD